MRMVNEAPSAFPSANTCRISSKDGGRAWESGPGERMDRLNARRAAPCRFRRLRFMTFGRGQGT